LLGAAEQLIRHRGPEHVTPQEVSDLANLSPSMFTRAFADREDCLLALFDELTARLRDDVLRVYDAEAAWADSVRAGITALLGFLDSEPRIARFLILGGLSADSPLVARRRRLLSELARSLEAGAPAPTPDSMPAPFGPEALIATAASIVHARLPEDPVPPLSALTPSLMALLVLPFLGEAAARAELLRAAPPPAKRSSRCAARDPEGQAAVFRMTARTRTVLSVIAATPGISNRGVALAAGDLDEGQVSRLLKRLSKLGLIVNERTDGDKPATNAWRVRAAGRRLLASPGPHRSR
jgi:AcrR family transcriptional regulator